MHLFGSTVIGNFESHDALKHSASVIKHCDKMVSSMIGIELGRENERKWYLHSQKCVNCGKFPFKFVHDLHGIELNDRKKTRKLWLFSIEISAGNFVIGNWPIRWRNVDIINTKISNFTAQEICLFLSVNCFLHTWACSQRND